MHLTRIKTLAYCTYDTTHLSSAGNANGALNQSFWLFFCNKRKAVITISEWFQSYHYLIAESSYVLNNVLKKQDGGLFGSYTKVEFVISLTGVGTNQ